MSRQILSLGDDREAFLDRVLSEFTTEPGVDHLVGIVTTTSPETWIEAIEATENRPNTGTLLDTTGQSTPGSNPTPPTGFEIRDKSGSPLSEVGTDVIESLRRAEPDRPSVVIDSVSALSSDPGNQFKFLTLLEKRLAKGDGVLRVFEAPEALEEFQVNTLSEVFDDVRDGNPSDDS